MQTLDTLQNALSNRIRTFFSELKISCDTGILEGTDKRFNGYPYIGANYCSAKKRILFVALDVGVDECFKDNTYHSFKSRESIFSDGSLSFNPHIAGLYCSSLYLLKDDMGYEESWNKLWSNNQYKMVRAIHEAEAYLPRNLMSYVAYLNRYSFVTVGRTTRGNGNDRFWINKVSESKFVTDMIRIFDPTVVIFQGKQGINNFNIKELKTKSDVYVLSHPSCWQHGADKLQYIASQLNK